MDVFIRNYTVTTHRTYQYQSSLPSTELNPAYIRIVDELSQRDDLFSRQVDPEFAIRIHISSCEGIDEGVQHMAQLLTQASAMLSVVVDGDLDDIEWVELFRPFIAMGTLWRVWEFADSVALAFKELNDVLQCLFTNGYSVFSLIDDILTQGCSQEDPRIELLREGVERDAARICSRLHNYNPASASVAAWALGFAQATTTTLPLRDNDVISPGLSPGMALRSTGGPERFLNMGKVLYKNYVTINVFPDIVFLDIFNFCLRGSTSSTMSMTGVIQRTRKWLILIHVCQRWRRIIFESPRGLNLHLSCSYGTPVRRNLHSWPITLPLAIYYTSDPSHLTPEDEDCMIYALKRATRVQCIDILVPGPLLRKVTTIMQKSFPVLTHLGLADSSDFDELLAPLIPGAGGLPPAIPGRFLGGSAPHLQDFRLERVPFPQLPTFLLSARNLINLKVENMCQNGFILPEDMVGGLAVLTVLRTLSITIYEGTRYPADQRRDRLDPPMRSTLPALTAFHYKGHSKYLEDFLAQIDTPRIDDLRIEFFTHEFQATQLSRFLNRTETLKFDQFNRARVNIYYNMVNVELCSSSLQGKRRQARLTLELVDQESLHFQVLCITDILDQLIPISSHVEHLDAHGDHVDSSEIADWLPFFRLFPAVETLHLSGGVAAYIVSALEDTANSEMFTDVFPQLRLIWLDDMHNMDCDKPVGSIDGFLAMRQRTGSPVTVVDTEDGFHRSYEKIS
ncbi:hypothetical protein H4582DRAFT_2085898 [Lactarius indigo]|nr:hypothetical protein H4582DRAFT_2085898 [Lactarius indigo]